ncbi:hypothetical protein [Bacillus sp. 03113]|uniref:hypothetical protein n=1 Tax=Bacillus sp. 03113 TaxID=2578211 RepID=UPI0011424A8D|nr:hypothetical protein [Bacillus sp. 03113]
MNKRLLLIWMVLIIGATASPFIFWHFKKPEDLNMLIIDKTVPDQTFREHQGLVWFLNQSKILKNGNKYDLKEDYVGFYPKGGTHYNIKPYPKKNDDDMIYIADGYGVFEEDLGIQAKEGNRSRLVYGGITSDDLSYIHSALHGKTKTLIGEFNTFASPTSQEERADLNDLYNVTWSGWIGRYFADLSSKEVPNWAKAAYKKQYHKEWRLTGKGLLFVNESNQLVIVTEDEIKDQTVWFHYTTQGKKDFKLNDTSSYEYWFDIVSPNNEKEVQAEFSFHLRKQGEEKLKRHGIPLKFPAIIHHRTDRYQTYYFAGDFADQGDVPSIYKTAFYPTWKKWTSQIGHEDASSFYWKIYIPLMKQVIHQHQAFSKQAGTMEQANIEMYENQQHKLAGKVGKDYLQVYQQGGWKDLLIKGVNMGISKPGYFPGETAISKKEYLRWFEEIGEMNANSIRVYTIHPPAFYEALAEYNATAKKPIYLFHGIWVNEEVFYESQDAFADENTKEFQEEMKRIVNIVHGNAILPKRKGHASGQYTADISPYLLGWIVGVEWDPTVTLSTNEKHKGMADFKGKYVYTENGQPFEIWLAQRMEETIQFEQETYHWQRPMSFTNWVTTDLLMHPSEPSENEDMVSINPNLIHATNQFEPGLFASYHIYPYYPEFLNYESRYVKYIDHRGEKNNYAGYLQHMKEVHSMPVLVAEFGVPASRGLTHRNVHGWDQGFHTEQEQGQILSRLYEDIVQEKMAGGMVFTWQDEWFKRTWNTMDYDNPNRRPFWTNLQTGEQHFGLLSFDPGSSLKVKIDGADDDWKALKSKTIYPASSNLSSLNVTSDEGYLYMKVQSKDIRNQKLYFLLNTIHHQGQSKISQIPSLQTEGIDFVAELHDKDSSHLWIDSYYDTFYFSYAHKLRMIPIVPNANQKDNGVFHPIRLTLNKELVIPDEKGNKNVVPFDSYETGKLRFGNSDPHSESFDSLADYNINEENGITEIRIPWALLNVKDPSTREVMGDVWSDKELSASEFIKGIQIGVVAVDKQNNQIVDSFPKLEGKKLPLSQFHLYKWNKWKQPTFHERLKPSYYLLKDTYGRINVE